jgi:hypothetical protein
MYTHIVCGLGFGGVARETAATPASGGDDGSAHRRSLHHHAKIGTVRVLLCLRPSLRLLLRKLFRVFLLLPVAFCRLCPPGGGGSTHAHRWSGDADSFNDRLLNTCAST